MRSNSEGYTVSTKRYRSASVQSFSLIVLFALCGTETRAARFAQDKAEPVAKPRLLLGVLIDTSAHQKNVIEFEREVVNSVADGFKGLAADSFVIRYADEVETLQEWAPPEVGLRQASSRVKLDAHSGQNRASLLYDALYASLAKLQSRDDASSKFLIIIAEGNDRGSRTKFSQVKVLAKSSRVQCFVLLVADHNLIGGRVRHFGFDLYDLASATKGKGYDVGDSRKHLDKAIKGLLKRMAQ
jgi:hypothetical protein